jgi:hypothetical protein
MRINPEGNPPAFERALIGLWLALDALDHLNDHVSGVCEKEMEALRNGTERPAEWCGTCRGCELYDLEIDAGYISGAVQLGIQTLEGQGYGLSADVKRLRDYAAKHHLAGDPGQLARAVLALSGADDDQECDAPQVVSAAQGAA